MKFYIVKVSDNKNKEEREINDIEDLWKIANEYKGLRYGDDDIPSLFISWEGFNAATGPTIVIVDDWLD
jgi:hypothetical protein